MTGIVGAIIQWDQISIADIVQIVLAAAAGSVVTAGLAERRLHVERRVSAIEEIARAKNSIRHTFRPMWGPRPQPAPTFCGEWDLRTTGWWMRSGGCRRR